MVILSDDAGQFNLLHHALCWVHIERNLQKIHAYTQPQRDQLDQVRQAFWEVYQLLNTCKATPSEALKQKCLNAFEAFATGKPNGSRYKRAWIKSRPTKMKCWSYWKTHKCPFTITKVKGIFASLSKSGRSVVRPAVKTAEKQRAANSTSPVGISCLIGSPRRIKLSNCLH